MLKTLQYLASRFAYQLFLVTVVFFIGINLVRAQTIQVPKFVSNPSAAFPSVFCADDVTNNNIAFKFDFSGSFAPGNTFQMQMSNDNFASNIIAVSGTIVTGVSPGYITLSIPNSVVAGNYRLRVFGSAPATAGAATTVFDFHYLKHNQQIPLNSPSTVTACGNNYTISIKNTGTSSSPLFYPDLVYKWFKNASPNPIQVGTSTFSNPNYTVPTSAPGDYFVITDYGLCSSSSNSTSGLVNVSFLPASTLTITSNNGTNFCQGTNYTLTGSINPAPGYSFKWFNGSTLIPSATTNTYVATQAGTYKLEVNTGSCLIESFITLTQTPITASLNVVSPSVIISGQIITIIASTTANSPTYEWVFNNVVQSETSNTFLANAAGIYKVKVTQTVGCITFKELTLVLNPSTSAPIIINEVPNLISPNNDGINDFWILPPAITSQGKIKVELLDSLGKLIYLTDNYLNDWPASDFDIPATNPVYYYIIYINDEPVRRGSITVIKTL